MAYLEIIEKDQKRCYQIKKKVTTIGSGDDSDIILLDPSILPLHANILHDGKSFIISPLSKDAKVLVRGRIVKGTRLEDNDCIKLPGVEMIFHTGEPSTPQTLKKAVSEEKSHLYESFRLIHSFSERLMKAEPLQKTFENLLTSLIEITRAEKGFLMVFKDNDFFIPASLNITNDKVVSLKEGKFFSDSIIKTVMKEKKAIIVSDALSDPVFGRSDSVVDLKLSSVMSAPLLIEDELLGLIYLGNDNISNLFTEEDLELLKILSAQASLLLHNAIIMDRLKLEKDGLKDELKRVHFGKLIGSCKVMQEVFKMVEKVAPTDISILIEGETGTGKELLAREIHSRSPRRNGPFIPINCAAIPEHLLESELFGHVKGSFTGAYFTKPGKFELASGGTLFLDEIGEMPPTLQVKLLRVLQDRFIERVGDVKPREIDIRVISATNKDLFKEVQEKRFREDLYYRLNEIKISLPPLRERKEDIPLIARYLLNILIPVYNKNIKGFSIDAMIAMRNYSWPGNIREMENKIKKAIVMSNKGLITRRDLELIEDEKKEFLSLHQAREEFSIDYVREVLELTSWNKTRAAEILEVDPRTIFRYIDKIVEKKGRNGGIPDEERGASLTKNEME